MRKTNISKIIIIAIFVLLLINVPIGIYLYSLDDENKNTLTDTEIYLLNPPQQNASVTEKKNHEITVENNTQEGTALYIGKNCRMFPLVLKVPPYTEFSIKNTDTRTRTISFTKKMTYRLRAGQEISIFAQFPNENATYGYTCDKPSQTSLSGYVVISP